MATTTHFEVPQEDKRKFRSYWVTNGENRITFDNFTGGLIWTIIELKQEITELKRKLDEKEVWQQLNKS